MKLLIRITGFLFIFIVVTLSIVHLINMNVIINEMNDVSSIAISQAQDYALDYIMNDYTAISDGIYLQKQDEQKQNVSELNAEYQKRCRDYLEYSMSDPNIYDFDIKTDITKGIIYLKIKCHKYSYIRDKELLNIVTMKKGYQSAKTWSKKATVKPDSPYIRENKGTMKDEIPTSVNFNSLVGNKDWPVSIYTWEFDEPTKVLGYDIDVFSYISTDFANYNSHWHPALKLSYLDQNGNWHNIASKNESNEIDNERLEDDADIEAVKVKLEITSYYPRNGYKAKIDRMDSDDSYLILEQKTYQYVTEWNEDIEDEFKVGSREVFYDFNYRYKDPKQKENLYLQ